MKRTQNIRQIASYLLVGASTALVELALFQILYLFTPMGVVESNLIAVFVSTACNFALNGTVTFKTSSNMLRSVVLYVALFLFNTAFSTFTIAALVGLGVHSFIAKVCTMACIVLWNFVLYKKVVFS